MTQFYNQRQTHSTHKGLFHPVGAGRVGRGEGGAPQGLVFSKGVIQWGHCLGPIRSRCR